jgi:hypothetical protein
MCNTYVKSDSTRKIRKRFWYKFHNVTVSHRTVHRIVNKLRQNKTVAGQTTQTEMPSVH